MRACAIAYASPRGSGVSPPRTEKLPVPLFCALLAACSFGDYQRASCAFARAFYGPALPQSPFVHAQCSPLLAVRTGASGPQTSETYNALSYLLHSQLCAIVFPFVQSCGVQARPVLPHLVFAYTSCTPKHIVSHPHTWAGAEPMISYPKAAFSTSRRFHRAHTQARGAKAFSVHILVFF